MGELAPYEGQRYFFLHVMKTAGGTFANYLRSNFPPGSVYPERGIETDMEAATYGIEHVLSLSAERRASIAVYTGHFPSIVPDLLDEDLVTMTILRDPVERAISYLRHCREHHPQHRDLTLSQIYDDDFYRRGFIEDHQVRQFAFTEDDPRTTYFEHFAITDERLALAQANLERTAAVGLAESFPEFIDAVRGRYGWGPLRRDDVHVSSDASDVPDALRQRIARDNEADRAFFDFAQALVARRGAFA